MIKVEMENFAEAIFELGVVDSIEDAEDFATDAYYVCREYNSNKEEAIDDLAYEIIDYCENIYDEKVSYEKAEKKAKSIFSIIFEKNLHESSCCTSNKRIYEKTEGFKFETGKSFGNKSLAKCLERHCHEFDKCKTKEEIIDLIEKITEEDDIIDHGTSQKAVDNFISSVINARSVRSVIEHIYNLILSGADGLPSIK